MRTLAKNDLWFLLRYILTSKEIRDPEGNVRLDHPWLFDRCREVQASPDGHIDIWAREHFKTTIITYGLTIFDILNDPDITVGIFSHSRPLAKRVLRQIMQEFERNDLLKELFSDVLYSAPRKDSPKWSEDDGIVVKRKTNPSASTVEAWGLVDGQPIGKHFRVLVYDDVVTNESVATPEMTQKTTAAWENSTNLGMEGGVIRYIGTRYAYGDTYRVIMDRGAAEPRVYPCLQPPTLQDGKPVLYSKEYIQEKFDTQHHWTFSCQMLCDPKAEDVQGFNVELLQYYDADPEDMARGKNVYILVDPANEKKKHSDYTAIVVVGLGFDQNYYILDIERERLNLLERTDLLFRLCRKWKPLEVRYERYGLQADVEHIRYKQNLLGYHFRIEEVAGSTRKSDRVARLVPVVQSCRMYLPRKIVKLNRDRRTVDLVNEFRLEMEAFPIGTHDDMLDALSRITEPDLEAFFPLSDHIAPNYDKYERKRRERDYLSPGSWMSA